MFYQINYNNKTKRAKITNKNASMEGLKNYILNQFGIDAEYNLMFVNSKNQKSEVHTNSDLQKIISDDSLAVKKFYNFEIKPTYEENEEMTSITSVSSDSFNDSNSFEIIQPSFVNKTGDLKNCRVSEIKKKIEETEKNEVELIKEEKNEEIKNEENKIQNEESISKSTEKIYMKDDNEEIIKENKNDEDYNYKNLEEKNYCNNFKEKQNIIT